MRLIYRMPWYASFFLIFGALCAFSGRAHGQEPAFRPGELLVKFRSGYRSSALENDTGGNRARLRRTFNGNRLHHLQLPENLSVAQAIEMYRKDPAVLYAEPNYLLHTQTMPGIFNVSGTVDTPNDPFFERLWALSNAGQDVSGYSGTPGADLDAVRAWRITCGAPETVVAVIDTGVNYNHPDLATNLWTNDLEIPDNGLDDDGNGYIDDVHGWDFADHDNSPMDVSGHGTHVAGIIAAEGNNAIGVAGVAWNARVMPLRFMDGFEVGTTADAIAAIEYAEAMGVRVINCSWGSNSYSVALRQAMADSEALFICAAGNQGTDNDRENFYPAGYGLANIVSVAASDQMDALAWFSNFGMRSVHVAAPGIRIYSLAGSRQTLWEETFDDQGIDAWTLGGTADFWSNQVPPNSQNSALTGIPADGCEDRVDAWAASPALDLSQAAGVKLEFRVQGGCRDCAGRLLVELSTDQVNWVPGPLKLNGAVVDTGFSDYLPYWTPALLDLGPWEGQPTLFVRFRFHTATVVPGDGYAIDNLYVSAAAQHESYTYMGGTSMAAAHVSGLAALIGSQDPGLTGSQISSLIIDGVDLVPDLKDRTISGGRISALNALTLLGKLKLSASPASTDRVTLDWTCKEPLNGQVVVERRAEWETEFSQVAAVEGNVQQFIDEALEPNTTYYYRVQAQTANGRQGYSNQSGATTLDQPPNAGGAGGGGCFIDSLKTVW